MGDPNRNDLQGWFQRNQKAVLIGGAIALLLAAVGSGSEISSGGDYQQPSQPCGGPNQPSCSQGGDQGGGGTGYGDQGSGGTGYGDQGGGGQSGGGPVAGGGSPSDGGVDMDQWRRDQERSDREQRNRIDAIREEERCRRSDGSNEVVSIHTGC